MSAVKSKLRGFVPHKQSRNQTRIIQGGTNNIWYQITNAVDYTYDTIGELKTATGKEADTTARQLERFGYAYDAAGNLNYRTNHTLVQTFTVNSLNELSNVVRSGRITVEGTTTSKATNVTVNTTNALLYADYTFASTNHSLVDGKGSVLGIDNSRRQNQCSGIKGSRRFAYFTIR